MPDNKEWDKELYEGMTEEEWNEMILEAQQEAIERARKEKERGPVKRPFPKWAFWLIALAMFFNVLTLFPQSFSIPIIDFLKTSASLSLDQDIQSYKKSVVVIETPNSRGTGFSISEQGRILTNAHVVKDYEEVTIAFKDEGLFKGKVVESYPEIDLAVVEVGEENMPHLQLAKELSFTEDEPIRFIGNPLRFHGIANEGTIINFTQLKSWEAPVVMIQAPVYRGNSGSPIINEAGEVIGVIFATLQTDSFGKVGLFVPIDYYYEYSGRKPVDRP